MQERGYNTVICCTAARRKTSRAGCTAADSRLSFTGTGSHSVVWQMLVLLCSTEITHDAGTWYKIRTLGVFVLTAHACQLKRQHVTPVTREGASAWNRSASACSRDVAEEG